MNEIAVGVAMNQEKPKKVTQVFYNDRWVDKEHFRAFVYNQNQQKLAQSYQEYETLIGSGLWFPDKASALEAAKARTQFAELLEVKAESEIIELKKHKARKPKDGANS